jgi:hypothetical protein
MATSEKRYKTINADVSTYKRFLEFFRPREDADAVLNRLMDDSDELARIRSRKPLEVKSRS